MRLHRLPALLCILAACFSSESFAQILIADAGQSPCRIVIAEQASPTTRLAADELKRFLKQMTGAELAIVTDRQPAMPHEILLGDSTHLQALKTDINLLPLGDEGYILRTVGQNLVIAGSPVRGVLYGVYGLLEDHLGCRWFTPDVSRIPRRNRLTLPPIDQTVIPPLELRDPYVADCFDAEWSNRNRMNGSSRLSSGVHFGKGLYVHTFYTLVSPQKYFASHLEYFSLIKGKRTTQHGQLCLTNPDVAKIIIDEIRTRMRAEPSAMVFSVSQNDCAGYCQCDNCQAIATREASQMGPVLQLVNTVADAVAKDFPNQAIETLAYQWTRKPPATLKPRPNVIIRLCPIECCFGHPLETCDSPLNRSFMADLKGWSAICNRLWIWNYETNFASYLLPFPNYHVWGPNTRTMVQNHVRGIMTEDCYNCPNTELAALGGYVRAKLLWNPACDADAAINEFLAGVYGPAAASIRQYMDLLTAKVTSDNIHVKIYDPPTAAYLSQDLLARAEVLWNQAEAAVAGNAEILHRVRIARLSEDYAFFEHTRKFAPNGAAAIPRDRIERFFDTARTARLTVFRESGNNTLDDYRKRLAAPAK